MVHPKNNKNFFLLYEKLLEISSRNRMDPLSNYLRNHSEKREIALRRLGVICDQDINRIMKKYNAS